MVQRCCVPLCDTKVGDVDIKGVKVRFHRIPLISEKILKWKYQITNSGKYVPEPELTVNSRVCSKHFLRADYITYDNQKPGTAGNHVLTADAVPTVFKWNDSTGNDCEVSRAIPYVKKTSTQEDPTKNQEVQCSIEEDMLKQEIFRKNLIIRQLLQRLAELEGNGSQSQEITLNKTTSDNHNPLVLAQDIIRNGSLSRCDLSDAGRKRNIVNNTRTDTEESEPPQKIQLLDIPIDLSLK